MDGALTSGVVHGFQQSLEIPTGRGVERSRHVHFHIIL